MKKTFRKNFVILFAFSETCNFFFLTFQNQSAAGDVIQQIKIKKPNSVWYLY